MQRFHHYKSMALGLAIGLAATATSQAQSVPGCVTGVSDHGVERFSVNGLADLEQVTPISTDTVFHAASLAKQFTAYAVGLLAAEGKLSLDDDIRKHLPDMPDYGDPIRVRDLVHHTSGLRDQGALLHLSGWRPHDRVTRQDALSVIQRQKSLNFRPGTQDLYNNSGYTLLAEIVRKVSGQSLADFAKARVFTPLGMTSTRFYEDQDVLVRHRARGYRWTGAHWEGAQPALEVYGASNLLTTAKDLLAWQRFLMNPPAKEATVEWMRTTGRLTDGTPIGYGGGLYISQNGGRQSIGHDGLDGGFRAQTLAFPREELAVVTLCNDADADAGYLARGAADLTIPSAAPPADAARRELAGVWRSPETGMVMRVEWRDGRLNVPADRWRFDPQAEGQPPLLRVLYDPLPSRTYEKVTAATPADLKPYAGRYRSDELATSYEVAAKDGRLTITWPRMEPMALESVGGDHFVGSSLGGVTFTRDGAGRIDGLELSQRRVWRLRAERLD
ncbi:serine hydrolase [Caulobacter segnis]|uniref:serine hydrolase n=1 Tax=Caulobacter segnis TaxID=88688 RepID=UPI002410456E|nr:serine hydrolase [Caulobacter segnis]MDG2522754.1 serine hydrolase [Caulobacter segnis]